MSEITLQATHEWRIDGFASDPEDYITLELKGTEALDLYTSTTIRMTAWELHQLIERLQKIAEEVAR